MIHSKEELANRWEQWERVKEELSEMYEVRDPRRLDLMSDAIGRLEELVDAGGSTEGQHLLKPLNYEERLDFIKSKQTSHYALIQLSMLYDEVKKKAARLRVQK